MRRRRITRVTCLVCHRRQRLSLRTCMACLACADCGCRCAGFPMPLSLAFPAPDAAPRGMGAKAA